jgi:hypothetical protein
MRGKSHNRQHAGATHAPQQIVLRAIVGSLVVCATLGAAETHARTVSQYAGAALVRASSVFQLQAHAPHVVHVRAARVAHEQARDACAPHAQSYPLLFTSASGKQFTAALEMSRAKRGNLLSQNLALP